jgi:hypothetical protein
MSAKTGRLSWNEPDRCNAAARGYRISCSSTANAWNAAKSQSTRTSSGKLMKVRIADLAIVDLC